MALRPLLRVAHRLVGRKQVLREDVDAARVLELLRGLDRTSVPKGINLDAGHSIHPGLTPHLLRSLYMWRFQPWDRSEYVTGEHRVFRGGNGTERHYLHLAVAQRNDEHKPPRRFTLDYTRVVA